MDNNYSFFLGVRAIDGYIIACTSEMNDLSEFGYKASKLGTGYASMIYYQELIESNVRHFAFQDTTRAGAEKQDYIKAMASGKLCIYYLIREKV